ncbi:MAG TPA: radical SAM protein [Methylomusa anaerophila]|uniref:Heme chaperone HemW n=1 Tax=Methylomusa anaerophila TaxID=1930071 RepID=A0A348AFS1_9FIRM|nr:radical SAM protein [Methylomusa anaerophila]BBB89919.1 oxygen-independent coproporphyrinogen-III oxidase 1 [Methylomusa anaerophila]HML88355.1 radical SAM protein [Methylomusa anaerophila]
MFTNFLRVILARKLRPFEFIAGDCSEFDFNSPNLGIYIHVPFCKNLCPFCPYYKEKFETVLAAAYIKAIIKEINLRKPKTTINISGIYVGGGSPALIIDSFPGIFAEIGKYYRITGDIGIELHPDNISDSMLDKIKKTGFNMVSVGIQSFQKHLLENLGRFYKDYSIPLNKVKQFGFKAIDVDLIFGIPGQKEQELRLDFMTACENGATQISAYPFIDFSFARNSKKPLSQLHKKEMLDALVDISSTLGYERTSVWTFTKKGTPQYSSITRDNFIGFGPSAATLSSSQFSINTFSVKEYCNRMNDDQIATALTLNFTQRTRMLYWLFWNFYNLEVNDTAFHRLFNADLNKSFGIEFKLASMLGILKSTEDGYRLTDLGTYFFHRVEQHYTHQYIDKAWRICTRTPWPKKIALI